MLEQQTTSPNTLPEKNRKRLRRRAGASALAVVTAFGLSACGPDTDAQRPTPDTATKTTAATVETGPTTTTQTPEVNEQNESLNASIERLIDAAAHNLDTAERFESEGRTVWESGTVSFLFQTDKEGTVRLSGGPKDEYDWPAGSFYIDLSGNVTCESGLDAECLLKLDPEKVIAGDAGFIGADGTSANVYVEKRGGVNHFDVTEDGSVTHDQERAEWLWDDISKKIYDSATNDIPAAQPTTVESVAPTPEVEQTPESLDAQIDNYTSAAVGAMLESFQKNPPREQQPNQITNFPEDMTSFELGETYVIATYLSDTQQLSFSISYKDSDSIASVSFSVILTRESPMLVAQEMNAQTIADSLAGLGAEDEQATAFLANMTAEGIEFEDGKQTSAHQLIVAKLYDESKEYEVTLNELPDPTGGNGDVETGITDQKMIEDFLDKSTIP